MGTSSRRQRGLKRRRTPEKSAEQRVVERISPEVGGDSHMGEEEDVSDNMVVHKEPSVYDNLLMRLRSDNKVLSDAYKRRLRREEDESDTEEKEDGPDSFDNTSHDDLNKGIEDESAGEEVGTPEEINRIDNDSAESEETDAEDGCESSSVTGHSVSPRYTKQSDISRSRLWFFEGTRKILLYTEKAHFYHRFKIRGIKNLIIYSLPERKEFYPEIVNLLEGSQEMTCSVLFSQFDHSRVNSYHLVWQ